MNRATRNGQPHGDRLGHPAGGCPVGCAHRSWLEAYQAARAQAEAEREAVTLNWPGDLEHYRATMPALPTVHAFMVNR